MPECAARGCTKQVDPSKLMCSADWSQVPPYIQGRVYRTWRQATSRNATDECHAAYEQARADAIASI